MMNILKMLHNKLIELIVGKKPVMLNITVYGTVPITTNMLISGCKFYNI